MKKAAPFILLIILFLGAAWYSLTKEPDEVHELPPPHMPPAMPAVEQPPEIEPPPPAEDVKKDLEPEPVIIPDPLPRLNESDPQFTQSLAQIIGTEPVAEYLVKGQAISRIVTMMDSLTSRRVSTLINPIKPTDDIFVVETEGDRVFMSEQNFARYDGYISVLQSMDTDEMMAIYERYYLLFQQAWEENGGEGSFNTRLIEIIDNLLGTPDVPGPIYLTKPEAFYLFEDPELETMSAGQKILVRMGSANAAIVKDKLAELRVALNP